MNNLKRFFILGLLLCWGASSGAQSCLQFFNARELSQVKELRVMSLNLRDFFLKVGKYESLNQEEFYKNFRVDPKPEGEVQKIVEAIQNSNSDIIILQETNLESLSYLAKDKLGDQWKPYLIEGNDKRQIGFLVKSNLPLDATLQTHRETEWSGTNGNHGHQVFARDLPALILKRKKETSPVLIVLGAHGHAAGGTNGRPKYTELKIAEKQAMAQIIHGFKEKYGEKVPLLLAGDFNANIRDKGEMSPLFKELKESFDSYNVPRNKRFTHYFLGNDGTRIMRQIDAIFTSVELSRYIKRAFVYPYKHYQKVELLPVDTPPELLPENPSDHYPVVVDLSTVLIFPEAH